MHERVQAQPWPHMPLKYALTRGPTVCTQLVDQTCQENLVAVVVIVVVVVLCVVRYTACTYIYIYIYRTHIH